MKKPLSHNHTLFGINGIGRLLSVSRFSITKIILQEQGTADRNPQLQQLIADYADKVIRMKPDLFQDQFGKYRTQGIVVQFTGNLTVPLPAFRDKKGPLCLLALDRIHDPQNLGQIIRTAECAGIQGILLPRHDSCGMTDTVIQVSQGAFASLPIYEIGNLHQTLETLKAENFWIYGLENGLQAKQWFELDYSGRVVIVMGSEGQGIRPLVLKTCDEVATIPMQGKMDSLNISAAVSAVLFERLRQLRS
jgi:23S rRNA (guanosine2251-2'-O)-methyltransferase